MFNKNKEESKDDIECDMIPCMPFNSYNYSNEYLVDCQICYTEFNMVETKNAYLECKCLIHSKCFIDYVKNEVNNNNLPILCPNNKCRKKINEKFISKCLEQKLYK